MAEVHPQNGDCRRRHAADAAGLTERERAEPPELLPQFRRESGAVVREVARNGEVFVGSHPLGFALLPFDVAGVAGTAHDPLHLLRLEHLECSDDAGEGVRGAAGFEKPCDIELRPLQKAGDGGGRRERKAGLFEPGEGIAVRIDLD